MRGDKVVIGPLEIAIIALILLVIFGAKYLPQLGRSAGKGVRIGSEKGKELAAVAQEKAKDVDTKAIARQAGDHVREARELRDVVKGTGDAVKGTSQTSDPAQQPAPQQAVPAAEPAPAPAAAAAAAAAGEAAPDQPEAPSGHDQPAGADAGDDRGDSGAGDAGADSAGSDSGSDSGSSDSGSSDSGGGDSGGGGGD